MEKIYQQVTRTILHYLIIHLFLTLTSLPILVAWGLPLSRLSLFGNLFFSPILFLFLLISSAVFFFEIMHIPHGFIAWLLEKITLLWQWLLPLHGDDALYGLSKPASWLLLLLAIIPFLLITHPQMRTPKNRMIGVLLLLLGNIIIIQCMSPSPSPATTIPCHGGEVILLHQNEKTILIDPGCIGRRISAPSWASYTLTPELITKTGRLTIDHCIILKPNIMTLEAICSLSDTIKINNIYIPYMYGELTGSLRIAWAKLYNRLQQNKTIIHRIYEDQAVTVAEEKITLSLHPEGKITYREITYPHLHIRGFIDDEPVNL